MNRPPTRPRPASPARCTWSTARARSPAVTLDWPGVRPLWVGESGMWPELAPGAKDDPATLRALFVLKEAGARLGPLASSDDRAVTFLIDAPTPQGLDELERRVRGAVTVTTDPEADGEH